MRTVFFTLILSIFLATGICKAQETKGTFKICNFTAKILTLETLKKLSSDSCGQLIYTTPEGDELKIVSYTFAHSPKKGGNAYFEQVTGNQLTETIKNKLKEANVNDMTVIANVEIINKEGNKKMLSGFNLTVTQ